MSLGFLSQLFSMNTVENAGAERVVLFWRGFRILVSK